jgi:hypothetical protein
MTIDPRGLTVTDWCDSMALPLSVVMTPQTLLDPDDWIDWANNVIQVPAISALRPPQPDGFADWIEWAIRFNSTVENLI